MLGWFLALLGWSFGFFMVWVAYRFYKKAVVYDTIFQYLYDDINTNLKQMAKVVYSPTLSNEPEVKAVHGNILIMGKRLEEILRQMEEATGLNMRPPPPPGPPPKVV